MKKLILLCCLLIACNSPTEIQMQEQEQEQETLRYHISQPYSDGLFPDTVYVHIYSKHLPAHYNLWLYDNDEDGGATNKTGTVNDMNNWAFVIQYFSLTPTAEFTIWNELGDTLSFEWRADNTYALSAVLGHDTNAIIISF